MGSVRKLLVAAAGLISTALAQGLLPDPWDKWATAALGALAAYGVWRVPNVESGTH